MAIAGNDIAISNTASSSNNVSVSSVMTALTGTGSTNPSVANPQTLTPVTTSSTSQPETNSLWGSLLGGLSKTPTTGTTVPTAGRYDTSQAYGGAGLTVKTNSQTMLWLLMAGGLFLVMMVPPSGGHRR